MLDKIDLKKMTIAVAVILLCVISVFIISPKLMNDVKYEKITETIETQISTVQKLSGASVLASAALSAIPGDTATPIAEKMTDFTEYFLIILSILYLERYCLPLIIGIGVCKILVPIAGAIYIISVFKDSKIWKHLALKIVLFAAAIALIIPASVKISETIYKNYNDEIDNMVSAVDQLNEDANTISEANTIGNLLGSLTNAVETILQRASDIISNLIEMTAVMIVAACVVPVLVILFFIWLIKMLSNNDILQSIALLSKDNK